MSNRLINKGSKNKNINKNMKNINNDSVNNINITTSNNWNNKMLTKTIICNKGLVMLQWNAKGLRSMGHGDELKKFVTDLNNKIYIVCIQDPRLITLPLKVRKLNFFLNSKFQVSKEYLIIPQVRLGEVLLFLSEMVSLINHFHCCRPP